MAEIRTDVYACVLELQVYSHTNITHITNGHMGMYVAVSVCVSMWIHLFLLHVCRPIHMPMYTNVCTHAHTWVGLSMYGHVCVCIRVARLTCIPTRRGLYKHVHDPVHVHVCLGLCVQMCVRVDIHT